MGNSRGVESHEHQYLDMVWVNPEDVNASPNDLVSGYQCACGDLHVVVHRARPNCG